MTLTALDIIIAAAVVWLPFLTIYGLAVLAKGVLPTTEEVDEFMASTYPDLHAKHQAAQVTDR